MKNLLIAAPLSLLLFGCGSSQPENVIPPASEQSSAPSGPTGKIRGAVRFQGEAPPEAFEPITENTKVCGDRVQVTRLMLGKDKGVRNAFVFLDGVQSTQKFQAQKSLLVDQKDCQYLPHALVAPAGGKIDITNSDPILHNVHAHQVTEQGQTTLFNIAQPVQGQRTTVDSSLTPGIMHLTCEAGHPWMSGYVFVANHPFVTVSSADGEFLIEGVPPGTYTIKMWHEGVRLKRNIQMLQRYEYEEPYEVVQKVTVEANGEAVVNFDLALR
jgi:hypothetical protein